MQDNYYVQAWGKITTLLKIIFLSLMVHVRRVFKGRSVAFWWGATGLLTPYILGAAYTLDLLFLFNADAFTGAQRVAFVVCAMVTTFFGWLFGTIGDM